jgi:hypothetical protein
MATLAKKFFTPAEYFKLEETSEDKHEYRDGVIVPKRPDGKWELIEYAQLTDKVAIPLIGVHVPLAAIYDMVDWLQTATKKSKPKRQ